MKQFHFCVAILLSASLVWTSGGVVFANTRFGVDETHSNVAPWFFAENALAARSVVALRSPFAISMGRLILIFLTAAGLSAQEGTMPMKEAASDASSLSHQRAAGPVTVDEVNNIIEDLRQNSQDLKDSVDLYHKRLKAAIAQYDRGKDAADFDLADGPADTVLEAHRKLFALRMAIAKSAGPLNDLNHIQDLIAKSIKSLSFADELLLRLGVVSVKELNSDTQKTWATKRKQLRDTHAILEKQAIAALGALPIDLPEDDSDIGLTFEQRLAQLYSAGSQGPSKPSDTVSQTAARKPLGKASSALPIQRIDHKRVTLVDLPGYRVAMTYAGLINGQPVFDQEIWETRSGKASGQSSFIVWKRAHVTVDPQTGQHRLLQRYKPLLMRGDLAVLFKEVPKYNYLWHQLARPTEEPDPVEAESVMAREERATLSLLTVIQNFESATQAARERDHLDDNPLENTLFKIRAHLAGIQLDEEMNVREAMDHVSHSVSELEQLAAWANLLQPGDRSSAKRSSEEWEEFQNRAVTQIQSTQMVIIKAQTSLPPDLSKTVDKFDALQEGLIVHMLRLPSQDEDVRCVQELWEWIPVKSGNPRVQRTIIRFRINRKTGQQVLLSRRSITYSARAHDTLEGFYDLESSRYDPTMDSYSDFTVQVKPPSASASSLASMNPSELRQRTNLLGKLFWAIPYRAAPANAPTAYKNLADEMKNSSEEAVFRFVKSILAGDQLPFKDPRINGMLGLLQEQRYVDWLQEDRALSRDIQRILQDRLKRLLPSDPSLRIIFTLLGLDEHQPVYENKNVYELLALSLNLDADSDAWRVLGDHIAKRLQDPKQFQTLTEICQTTMAGVGGGLLPGDVRQLRMGLLQLANAVPEYLERDYKFRATLERFIIAAADRSVPGFEQALLFLRGRKDITLLKEAYLKLEKSKHNEVLKSERGKIILKKLEDLEKLKAGVSPSAIFHAA